MALGFFKKIGNFLKKTWDGVKKVVQKVAPVVKKALPFVTPLLQMTPLAPAVPFLNKGIDIAQRPTANGGVGDAAGKVLSRATSLIRNSPRTESPRIRFKT